MKDFKANNPTLSFLSSAQEEQPAEEVGSSQKPPKGYKLNPMYVETKSKRMQLLVQPSVYESLKSLAKEKSISVNEIANVALREYLEREGR